MIVTKKVKIKMGSEDKEALIKVIRSAAGFSNDIIFNYVNELISTAVDIAQEANENEQ